MTSSSSPPYLLNTLIDPRFLSSQNATKSHPIQHAFSDSSQYLASNDGDALLILYVPFQGKVQLSTMVFEYVDAESCPRIMRFFVNQTPDGVDFENYEDLNEVQSVEFERPDSEDEEQLDKEVAPSLHTCVVKFRAAKFKMVSSMHIVVESNHGSKSATKLSNIRLYGKTFGRNESLKKNYIPEAVLHTRYGGYRGDEL